MWISFLSLNKADEIQVRGRVARKNERGSFALILNWEDIGGQVDRGQVETLKQRWSAMSAMQRYTVLDELRTSASSNGFEKQCSLAEKRYELHCDTMDVRRSLLTTPRRCACNSLDVLCFPDSLMRSSLRQRATTLKRAERNAVISLNSLRNCNSLCPR